MVIFSLNKESMGKIHNKFMTVSASEEEGNVIVLGKTFIICNVQTWNKYQSTAKANMTKCWHFYCLDVDIVNFGGKQMLCLSYFSYYVLIFQNKIQRESYTVKADNFITMFSKLNISRTYAYATLKDISIRIIQLRNLIIEKTLNFAENIYIYIFNKKLE